MNSMYRLIIGFVCLSTFFAPAQVLGKGTDIPLRSPLSVADSVQTPSTLLTWRDFFRDEQLNGLINTAIEQNFDLRSALKNVELAEQELRQARKGWLPELSLSPAASYGRNTNQERERGLSARTESYAIPLQFSWEVDVWGKIRQEKRAARSEYMRSEEARRAVMSSVVSNVATTYYDLLLLNQQREIVDRGIALNDSVLTMLRVQFKLGDITQPILSQAEAQHRSQLLARMQLKSQIERTTHALALLLGQTELERGITIPTGFPQSDSGDLTQAGIPVSLLQNRPDVKAAEWALQAANARVGIARRNFYPTLTLQAQGGLRSAGISSLFSVDKALFGLLDGAISQPLFARGRLKKEYAQARILKEQSEIEFQRSFTTACVEVADELTDIASLREQCVEARNRALDLEKALRDSRLLFRSGKIIYLEVLTLQRDLLQARMDEADIICRKRKAEVMLYRALGGGCYL